jgi:RNA polymerase sigma-70 factor (ECF subfamily)
MVVPRSAEHPTPAPAATPVHRLEDLFRSHAADVARWAARLGGPRVDADDVVQEVFMVAGRRLAEFRGQARPSTWLFRITDRVVRNHRRWLRVRRILTVLTARHDEIVDAARPDPLDELAQRESALLAYRILDAMPDRHRRVLVLFELEGLSSDEIAALLGARVQTVRVWLHRARRLFLERQHELERRRKETPG